MGAFDSLAAARTSEAQEAKMTEDNKMSEPPDYHERTPKIWLFLLQADVEDDQLKLALRFSCALAGDPKMLKERSFREDLTPYMRNPSTHKVQLTWSAARDPLVHALTGFPNAVHGLRFFDDQYPASMSKAAAIEEFLLLLYETYFPGSEVKQQISFTTREVNANVNHRLPAEFFPPLVPGVQACSIIAFLQRFDDPEQQVKMMRYLGAWFARRTREAINSQKRFLLREVFGKRP